MLLFFVQFCAFSLKNIVIGALKCYNYIGSLLTHKEVNMKRLLSVLLVLVMLLSAIPLSVSDRRRD